MKRAGWRVVSAALLVYLSLEPEARAQSASSLSEAQAAYAEVDYERTRMLASAAVRRGHGERESTGKLYLLWAISAAALGDADEARTAFSYAIAVKPELKLDRSLSPKMRAPYLEARGSLPEAEGPPLDVTLRRRKRDLELALHDASGLAAGVVVATRSRESSPFTQRRFDAAPVRRLPMPNGSDFEFFVQVLDRYENVLFSLGTEDAPERLVSADSEKPQLLPPSSRSKDASPVAYYVTAGSLAALGLAAGGVATAMFVRREKAAREWNGASCEQPGFTRAEQCQAVDDRRQLAERLAIGFAAAGGALLVGSVVTLVLAPSARANVSLNAGPGSVQLRLQGAL